MSSHSIDEEKGEGGLKHFEAGLRNSESVLESLTSATTLVNSGSACCGPPSPTIAQPRSSIWSRRMSSVIKSIGMSGNSNAQPSHADNKSSSVQPSETDNETDRDSDSDTDPDSIVRKIHRQPKGYPRLATFMDSDENFMVYRRFGYLQTRLLLERQDELNDLEFKLDIMETREGQRDPDSLKTRRGGDTNNIDEQMPKKNLLDEIETKWSSYIQLLSNAATMTALNKPTATEQGSVATWLLNTKALRPPEGRFIHCKEDLVILRPGREHAWLDSSVENMLRWCGWGALRRAFQSRDTRAKSNGKDGTVLYTRSRIENVVVSFITLVILALLVVPIGVLYWLTSNVNENMRDQSFGCIGVLLISTLAFSACLSLFTRARRHEILGASAAYCAVLVVFVGNIGHH